MSVGAHSRGDAKAPGYAVSTNTANVILWVQGLDAEACLGSSVPSTRTWQKLRAADATGYFRLPKYLF